MPSTSPLRADDPTDEPTTAEVGVLYGRGLYLQAFQAAARLGAPETWTDPADRVLGSNLYSQVGAPRRSALVLLRTWRAHRRHAEVAAAYILHVLTARGPVAAWEIARGTGEIDGTQGAHAVSWHLARALVHAYLRDFAGAEALLARARDLGDESAWIDCIAADVLEQEDRRDEALALLQAAAPTRAPYRAAVQREVSLLHQLGRVEEALACISRADEVFESSAVAFQRGALEAELGLHAASERSLRRGAALSPSLEPGAFLGLCIGMGHSAYLAGHVDEAIRLMRVVPAPPITAFVSRLEAARACRRKELTVPLVRQHHKTCAPATLTAISRYWQRPADHVEVAEAICYDGTSLMSERRWAEGAGFVAREFTVTWEAAVALVDRGVPFTLSTVEVTSAHLVSVVGYDPLHEVLLLRDPSLPCLREVDAKSFLERYRASGPRGMAMVPASEAARFAGVLLPEAELHDHLYALQLALHVHDRDRAVTAVGCLERDAPGHRLTLVAAFALAAYDGDERRMHALVVELRRLFPDDLQRALQESALLAQAARHPERRALLETLIAGEHPHPALRLAFAELLLEDDRERDRALWQMHMAALAGPGDGSGLALSARARWQGGDRAEAVERWRLAACLSAPDEGRAMTCYRALLELRGHEASLAYLKARVERLGARAAAPALSLARALAELDREPEAVEVLEDAMRRRPDDALLVVDAAVRTAQLHRGERAQALLQAARGKVQRGRWLRAAIQVAEALGDLESVPGLWRELLALEPLALDAHEALAASLGRAEGAAAGAAELRRAVTEHPAHVGLRRLLARFLGPVDANAAIEELRTCLRLHGEDSWTRREIALRLCGLGRHDEAFAEVQLALARQGHDAANHAMAGYVNRCAGRATEAVAAFKQALELDPSAAPALVELVRLSETPAAQRELLGSLERLGAGRGLPGSLVLTWIDSGGGAWDPPRSLALAEAAVRYRPDDAAASSALIAQRLAMGRSADALAQAELGVGRWPGRGRSWRDLARCRARTGDAKGARVALEHCLVLDAADVSAVLALAELHREAGDPEAARALLEARLAREPGRVPVRHALARHLAGQGESGPALDHLLAILERNPEDEQAWRFATGLARDLGRHTEVVALARRKVAEPDAPPQACLGLVRVLVPQDDAAAERLALLEAALARFPLDGDLHDERICELVRHGRMDDAAAACHSPVWQGRPPVFLSGRAAWLRAQRGDVNGAIDEMAALLREAPWYDWGIARLEGWCGQAKRPRVLVELGEKLVAAHGGDGELCFVIAGAHAAAGDQHGQEAWLRRVLLDQPGHEAARQLLFDAALGRGQVAEARALLREGDEQNPYFTARLVDAHLRELDTPAALVAFERTCAITGDAPWPVQHAAQVLERYRRGKDVLEILWRRVTTTPVARLPVLKEWARQAAMRVAPPVSFYRLARLRRREEVGERVVASGLEGGVLGYLTLPFVLLFARFLRRSARTWSAAGMTLLGRGRFRIAYRWLRGWRGRAVQPYMLCNVATAARVVGRHAEAAEASRHALTLPPDHTATRHRLWLALDAAVGRRTEEARALRRACPSVDPGHDTFVAGLLDLLFELAEGPEAERRARAARARRALPALEAQTLPVNRPRSMSRRVARAIRDADAGIAGWWWWLNRPRR